MRLSTSVGRTADPTYLHEGVRGGKDHRCRLHDDDANGGHGALAVITVTTVTGSTE